MLRMSWSSELNNIMRWTTFANVIFPRSCTKWSAASWRMELYMRRDDGIMYDCLWADDSATSVLHMGQRFLWRNSTKMHLAWKVWPHSRTKRPLSNWMSSQHMEQQPRPKDAEAFSTEPAPTLPTFCCCCCIFCMFFSFSERLTTLLIMLLIISEANLFTERVFTGM